METVLASACINVFDCFSKWRTDLVRPVREADFVEVLDVEGVEEEVGDVGGVAEEADLRIKTRNGAL